jgi:hypothetical protein
MRPYCARMRNSARPSARRVRQLARQAPITFVVLLFRGGAPRYTGVGRQPRVRWRKRLGSNLDGLSTRRNLLPAARGAPPFRKSAARKHPVSSGFSAITKTRVRKQPARASSSLPRTKRTHARRRERVRRESRFASITAAALVCATPDTLPDGKRGLLPGSKSSSAQRRGRGMLMLAPAI